MQLLPFLFALLLAPLSPLAPDRALTGVDEGPVMVNPGFECADGFHDQPGIPGMVPNGWDAKTLGGSPKVLSTQLWAKLGGCDPKDMSWEKLEGSDSLILLPGEVLYGQDFDAPPYDIALWQKVKVTPGADYSISAWMTSLCGGSSNPNDCPTGAYMAKMAALDPTGGEDPESASLAWVEDRRPHLEARWANLVAATTATSDTLTVFLRLNSPTRHHGNHAFADAVKLVRSPSATLAPVKVDGRQMTVAWDGSLGPDIPAIPASTHKLSFELQARVDGGAWQPWLRPAAAGSEKVVAPGACLDHEYQFRVRSWAIQPTGKPGSWPFHEFFGVWQESARTLMKGTVDLLPEALPAADGAVKPGCPAPRQ